MRIRYDSPSRKCFQAKRVFISRSPQAVDLSLTLAGSDSEVRILDGATTLRASTSDQSLARRLHFDFVETALMFGFLRRLIRLTDACQLSTRCSLAFFRPVIDELREHAAPKPFATTPPKLHQGVER